jgi:hypothetical protein
MKLVPPKQWVFQQKFEILRRVTQRCKHNSSAMTATIWCFIFPFNRMAKLTHFLHWM